MAQPDAWLETSLFRGRLVRLAPPDPEADAATLAAWTHDSRYLRLVDDDPAPPLTIGQARAGLAEGGWRAGGLHAHVRLLEDDRLVGFVVLHSVKWPHGSAYLSMGIGNPDDWGRGYGGDALDLALRYGFGELGLHRVALTVLEYNARAVRAYARAGFREEGRSREAVLRDGRRWDLVLMGLLRREFEAGGTEGVGR